MEITEKTQWIVEYIIMSKNMLELVAMVKMDYIVTTLQ